MDLSAFSSAQQRFLVEVEGSDLRSGAWTHRAFIPPPLQEIEPQLDGRTYLKVANARAALAALDSTARRLPNPTLLRTPTLRREAQATSALEGTYAPLQDVLTAIDGDEGGGALREVLNYVRAADAGFRAVAVGRSLSVGLLSSIQGLLMEGTPLESSAGSLREQQVVIGRRAGARPDALPVHAARFVPSPPGDRLRSGVDALMEWMGEDRSDRLDPVVCAALAHHQFETLHPFTDGNGRIGRLLIVLHLLSMGVLTEPTLTVSPWFEERREQYYDVLLGVSTTGMWNNYVSFFAQGVEAAASSTHQQMLALVEVQEELRAVVAASSLRANTAPQLVDHAVANPSFTTRSVEAALGISYPRASALIGQLIDLGILAEWGSRTRNRRFVAPRVLEILLP